MNHQQLIGRLLRLKQELADTFHARPWQGARVDRIAADLASTQHQLAALRPVDEQCDETRLPFLA